MTTTREVGGMNLAPGLYRHTKSGGLYTVFGLVRHHETGNPMVVYYSHGHGSVSTRPLYGFEGPRCSDPDGFVERFEFVANGAALSLPTVLWTHETLLRNFDLFEAALGGVGKPPGETRIAHALGLLDIVQSRTRAIESLGSLTSGEVIEMLATVRKALIGDDSIERADVSASPNTSAGTMDPESSLNRL